MYHAFVSILSYFLTKISCFGDTISRFIWTELGSREKTESPKKSAIIGLQRTWKVGVTYNLLKTDLLEWFTF